MLTMISVLDVELAKELVQLMLSGSLRKKPTNVISVKESLDVLKYVPKELSR